MSKYYTNSDIFNSYIDIAEKNGLVKVAEDMESDKSKAALEKNPRADSLTKEKIGKLYGLDIDSPKEMEYERNIVEVAHPKSKYIHNAYDKLNGLVENVNERQDIMMRIVNKRTNGAIAQHKYAQDEMIRTLVRIANDMDNRDEGELRALADECLGSLKKKVAFEFSDLADFSNIKEIPSWLRPFVSVVRADLPAAAIGALAATIIGVPAMPVVSGVAIAGSAIAPIISYLYGTAKRSEFIHHNCKNLLEKIDPVINDTSGVVNKYLNNLKEKTYNLESISKDYYEKSHAVISAHEGGGLKEEHAPEIEQTNENAKILEKKLKEIIVLLNKYFGVHNLILKQYREKEEIGDVQGKFIDWFSPLYSGFNPVLELYDAVNSLKESINDFQINGKSLAETLKEEAEKATEAASKKVQEETSKVREQVSQTAREHLGIDEDDEEILSKLFNSNSPSNDNAEAAAKAAARRKIVNIIKNS